MSLKPCPYRHVGDEGHILCDKIKSGDREVAPNICRVCPIAQIDCTHLRATLDHQAHPPVVVRWGNGKTEVWEDDAPSVAFIHAACAEKVIPIHSPRDCAGCALRQPFVLAESIQPAVHAQAPAVGNRQANPRQTRRAPAVPVMQPVAQVVQPAPVAQVQPTPQPDARSTVVAQKIIQLQEWLAKSIAHKKSEGEAQPIQPIAQSAHPAARVVGEEKRVGWTD